MGQSAKKSRGDASFDENVRGWAKILCLWRLCGSTACRRTQACRGNARACFQANYPLLPEAPRAFFEGLGEAQKEGMSFDEALAWLDECGVGEEFGAWCEAVHKSIGAGQAAE